MRTIWDVAKDLKKATTKIEKLKASRYVINRESHDIIKRMTLEEVEIILQKVYKYLRVYETSGPHDDYWVVYSDVGSSRPLASGDDREEAMRNALKEYVWNEGQEINELDD